MKNWLNIFFVFMFFLFVLFLCLRLTSAQPPSMPPRGIQAGPEGMLTPGEIERMKQEVKLTRTDSINFNKRVEFARAWLMQLAAKGKADKVIRVAPPGTIPRIKQTANSDPYRAYKELDDLFRELERIESLPVGPKPPGSKTTLPMPGLPPVPVGVASKEMDIVNPTSNARLWAKVYYPADATRKKRYPAVVLIPGALGYGSEDMAQREAEIIAKGGFVAGIFDPDGRGRSEGKEDWNGIIQQDGLNAFIKAVSELEFVDKENIGVVSRSYGIALASGALARYPDNPRVNYLVDVEGPSDRFYITFNDSPVVLPIFDNHKTTDREWWWEREPINWISKIRARYLRIQHEIDHAQPKGIKTKNDHAPAIDLINAATNVSYGGKGQSIWTRVNGRENEPNRVYTKDNPPKWLPGKGMLPPGALLQYIKEMAQIPEASRTEKKTLKVASPLYFYVEFHVEAIIKNKEAFDKETELLKRLADILERHNARGSFMFLDIYPRAVKKYEPESKNIIQILEERGHEIGVHYHPLSFFVPGERETQDITIKSTINDIKNSGAKNVTSLTTSFHIKPVFPTEDERYFDEEKKRAEVERMIDDMYNLGITSAFRWCMEGTTPYKPRRDNWITYDIKDCKKERQDHDPNGKIVAVGMYEDAGYTFPEDKEEESFADIISRLDRALSRMEEKEVNYFPLAIHDYYFFNPSGKMSINRIGEINEERLKAFDNFLSRIDEYVKKQMLIYATRRDVTNAYLDWEKKSAPISSGLKSEDAKLNIFYLIHVHSAGNNKPEFHPMSEAEFKGTVKAINTIAKTLESHSAKGIFHFLQNFPDAVLKYQGDKDNILKELERRGHEIGAHAHADISDQWKKTRDSILAAGIQDIYSISGLKKASVSVVEAFRRIAELGFEITTGNNTPLDPFPLKGMKGVDDWGLGGNDVYKETGTFIHPWRPDYENNQIAKHSEKGQVLYIDQVGLHLWFSDDEGAGVGSRDFARLKPYFDAALKYIDKDQVTTWGFVTHETEYQMTETGFKPTNPVNEQSIKALDDFLKYINNSRDKIRWVTIKDIYKEFKR